MQELRRVRSGIVHENVSHSFAPSTSTSLPAHDETVYPFYEIPLRDVSSFKEDLVVTSYTRRGFLVVVVNGATSSRLKRTKYRRK